MGEFWKKAKHKSLHSDSLIFTFFRSIVSSQAASWVDLGLSFALFAWIGLTSFLSTACGAVAGGIVNCVINYKFTFHADGCSWSSVVVKYAMVWVGSLLLNSFGTQLLCYAFEGWDWLREIGFSIDGCFAAARLIVSLLVSWFWNFLLQRYFVYRPTCFDPKAEAFVRLFTGPGRKRRTSNNESTKDNE